METNMLIGKVVAGVLAWAVYSLLAGIIAVAADAPLVALVIGSVLGFAGLLVRQIFVYQRSMNGFLAQRDNDNLDLRIELDYVRWERNVAQARAGERPEPGPYALRPDLAAMLKQRNPTTDSQPQEAA